MAANLYIPSKIKVGFQSRDDTFTGKLAYVVYFDDKNVLRKEKSWNSWCDKKIVAMEYDNIPTKFLLNKGVSRQGYFGSGRSLIRVYDERDFEFEISIENLMGILMHSDVSKRDVVEPCVFAWSGQDLVLLPVNSDEYVQAVAYTKKQADKVSAKSLVKGYTYSQKKSDVNLVYMGQFDWWQWTYVDGVHSHTNKGKKHIFYDGRNFSPVGVDRLSSVCSDAVCDNYAKLVDKFYNTKESSPITKYSYMDRNSFNTYDDSHLYADYAGCVLKVHYGYTRFYNAKNFSDLIRINRLYRTNVNSHGSLSFMDDDSYCDIRNNSWDVKHSKFTMDFKTSIDEFANKHGLLFASLSTLTSNQCVAVLKKLLKDYGFKYLVVETDTGNKFGSPI